MYVYGWPFFSLQNKLQIVTRYTTDSAPAICENSRQSFDPNNNLQWLTITQDGVTLYLYYFLYSLPVLFQAKVGPNIKKNSRKTRKAQKTRKSQILLQIDQERYGKLLPFGLVDSKVTPIEYIYNKSAILVIAPHFWESVGMNFSPSILLFRVPIFSNFKFQHFLFSSLLLIFGLILVSIFLQPIFAFDFNSRSLPSELFDFDFQFAIFEFRFFR